LGLWNFNNGHNLYRIHSNEINGKEITALLHENERLFVAGWSRRIRVFYLGKSVVIRQGFLRTLNKRLLYNFFVFII
jgi:hypothetical protein